jgi:hypothetical protein
METIVIGHNGLEIRNNSVGSELVIEAFKVPLFKLEFEDIFVEKSRKKKWDKNKPFWDKG